ncbi:hypothetical protein IQ249_13405 [Lusitaniella coriacea LEGE 07157]|uniref:Uncharacterized protein n=1 Tax=Lusitaniella coriacea LEGE 07157 TaxID=945747 RepID=A0A8J7DYS2_9CYAN|nr:UPF0175 family protein [Lusitaniella coriacea]MBE9116898.1 hypothetical protein [Lusitaniella coriacea LEGE 07157]
MSVVIPNEILQAAKLSEAELRLELAKRGICVHYDLEDLHADIETLQKLEQL